MNWSSRIPNRPPRRSTSPDPSGFVAVCGYGDLHRTAYRVGIAEAAAANHRAKYPGHAEVVEVVRADDIS